MPANLPILSSTSTVIPEISPWPFIDWNGAFPPKNATSITGFSWINAFSLSVKLNSLFLKEKYSSCNSLIKVGCSLLSFVIASLSSEIRWEFPFVVAK